MRHASFVALAALAIACGRSQPTGPWNTDPGVDGHARYFKLAGSAHDPSAPGALVSCEGCHPGTTFAQFDCATCHDAPTTDPIHTGVSGYVHASPDCLRCHPDGSVEAPSDHDTRFFPRGIGSAHAAIGGFCSRCHSDLSAPTNPDRFRCDGCHATLAGFSTAHAGVTGFTAGMQSADCLKCHGDSQVDRVAAHQARFPVVKGSATHDTVCLRCHTTMRTDKPFAASFGAFDCTACHASADTNPIHQGVSGYQYASASCYQCHPSGAGGAPSDHDTRLFPGAFAGSKHHDAGVTCAQCHTDAANPGDLTTLACASCHAQREATLVNDHLNPASAALDVASGEISATDARTCLRCHADSQVVTAHPSGGQGFPPHEGARCTQCHDVLRSDKPFGIDFGSDPALASKLAARQGCYHCHASAPPSGD